MSETEVSMSSEALIGRQLGEYILKEQIGKGGGGLAFLAEQLGLKRDVVVKVLRHAKQDDPRQRARFLREARLASQLDHPYAAHIYAFGAEDDGLLWLAMEYVRGRSLAQYLTQHTTLPADRLAPLLEALCEVVDAMHEQGVVHRDLKPSNVMVIWRSGRMLPKLIDLGVATRHEMLHPHSSQALDDPDILDLVHPDEPASDSGQTRSMPGVRSSSRRRSITPKPLSSASFDVALDAELTGADEAVGSPMYMAPEQWLGSNVDHRVDVYALGVLIYRCLVGELPFSGTSTKELFAAHTHRERPQLPPPLSHELNEVVQHALAVHPEDRPQTALELARAFRRAVMASAQTRHLPDLPADLKQAFINRAPQPIAEAMAIFDAARSAGQAATSLRHVAEATIRYAALLAIASHARLAELAPPASARLQTLLTTLHHTGLTSARWAEVARELLHPWRTRAQSHPIPELVQAIDAFEGWNELDGSAHGDELLDATILAAIVEPVGRLLARLESVLDYQLVFATDATCELWTGCRKPTRATVMPASALPFEHDFVLLDQDCAPVARLSPLIQALTPTPRAAPEVFWLDGNGRYGARLLSFPQPFERQDAGIWNFLDSVFPGSFSEVVKPGQERVPFRGLSAFTAADADYFFGREQEAQAVANRLKLYPLLTIAGPSGVGKSSFVQAGVIPLLHPAWQPLVVRPGSPGQPVCGSRSSLGAARHRPRRRQAPRSDGSGVARCHAASRGAGARRALRAGRRPVRRVADTVPVTRATHGLRGSARSRRDQCR